MSQVAARCRKLISGAVGEGGYHVAPTLCHCPAVLLPRAVESALSPGTVRVEGEHLLQVLKHVIKESSAKATLLKPPLMSVHSLLVSLEVFVKVSLLVSLILRVGVEVVLVSLLLTKMVKVFEDVIEIEVERLVVLVEVVITSSSVALPW